MNDTQAFVDALEKNPDLIEEAQTMLEVMGIQPTHSDAGGALLAFFIEGPLSIPQDVLNLAEKDNIDWDEVAKFISDVNG
jgi:hypothetical protein